MPAFLELFPLESGETVSSELALAQNVRVAIGVYEAQEELEITADAVCVCTHVCVTEVTGCCSLELSTLFLRQALLCLAGW